MEKTYREQLMEDIDDARVEEGRCYQAMLLAAEDFRKESARLADLLRQLAEIE